MFMCYSEMLVSMLRRAVQRQLGIGLILSERGSVLLVEYFLTSACLAVEAYKIGSM